MVDCPRAQSGPWNSRPPSWTRRRSRPSGLPLCVYGCHQPWRSETNRRPPSCRHCGCPTDTSAPASTVHGWPAATSRDAPCRVARHRQRMTMTADRSHGMSGWSQTTTARRCAVAYRAGGPRRSRDLRPESIPRASPAAFPAASAASGRCLARRRNGGVALRHRPRPVHLAHRHHPRPVRTGPEAAVGPALAVGGSGVRALRRPGRVAAIPVDRSPPRRRTPRPQLRDEAAGAPAVFVHPAADAHIGCGEILHPSSSARTKTTRPPSSGRDSSQYTSPSEQMSEATPSRGRSAGTERRGPAPERRDGVHPGERARSAGRWRRRPATRRRCRCCRPRWRAAPAPTGWSPPGVVTDKVDEMAQLVSEPVTTSEYWKVNSACWRRRQRDQRRRLRRRPRRGSPSVRAPRWSAPTAPLEL